MPAYSLRTSPKAWTDMISSLGRMVVLDGDGTTLIFFSMVQIVVPWPEGPVFVGFWGEDGSVVFNPLNPCRGCFWFLVLNWSSGTDMKFLPGQADPRRSWM